MAMFASVVRKLKPAGSSVLYLGLFFSMFSLMYVFPKTNMAARLVTMEKSVLAILRHINTSGCITHDFSIYVFRVDCRFVAVDVLSCLLRAGSRLSIFRKFGPDTVSHTTVSIFPTLLRPVEALTL